MRFIELYNMLLECFHVLVKLSEGEIMQVTQSYVSIGQPLSPNRLTDFCH